MAQKGVDETHFNHITKTQLHDAIIPPVIKSHNDRSGMALAFERIEVIAAYPPTDPAPGDSSQGRDIGDAVHAAPQPCIHERLTHVKPSQREFMRGGASRAKRVSEPLP